VGLPALLKVWVMNEKEREKEKQSSAPPMSHQNAQKRNGQTVMMCINKATIEVA